MAPRTRNMLALAAVILIAAAAAAIVLHRHAATHAPIRPVTVPASKPPNPAAPVAMDCQLPGPAPVPPDGYVATADDMKLGHDVIQNFVLQLEAYQTCRNNQIDHAGRDVTAARKQIWLDQGNAAVDQAHDLAHAFSIQLQAFKARQVTVRPGMTQ